MKQIAKSGDFAICRKIRLNMNKLCYTPAALNGEHFLGNGFDRSKLQAR
jgi:hypothetical protein